MIKAVCDICHKEVKQIPGVNFCERCQPYASKWAEELIKFNAEITMDAQRKYESFRNKFLKDVVLINKPKLEAVNQ
jgi:hypothetical protein